MTDQYVCPVCGFPCLDEPPRRPHGGGSYEICASCGFQFGVTDEDRGYTYAGWRRIWIERGMPWRDEGINDPPEGWDPAAQLARLLSCGDGNASANRVICLPPVLERIAELVRAEFGELCRVVSALEGEQGLPAIELVPNNPRSAQIWIAGFDQGLIFVITSIDVLEPLLSSEDEAVEWAINEIHGVAEYGLIKATSGDGSRFCALPRSDSLMTNLSGRCAPVGAFERFVSGNLGKRSPCCAGNRFVN